MSYLSDTLAMGILSLAVYQILLHVFFIVSKFFLDFLHIRNNSNLLWYFLI